MVSHLHAYSTIVLEFSLIDILNYGRDKDTKQREFLSFKASVNNNNNNNNKFCDLDSLSGALSSGEYDP